MRRLALFLVLLVAWGAFGYGVNRLLSSRKSTVTTARTAVAPSQEKPRVTVPGTIWVSQNGHIYRMGGGEFTDLRLPASNGSWIQPALGGAGRLLVVARSDAFSDVYLVDGNSGQVLQQLTSNASRSGRVELNAWSYWPHLTAGGTSVVFDYDGPKTGASFQVDFAVWSGPLIGKLESTKWTTPNPYTGGDVTPVPLPDGRILYANYLLSPDQQIVSRIATVARPDGTPTFVTAGADDCSEPAVSPDGSQLAVICTSDSQSARLEVIPLNGAAPSGAHVLVSNCLCASPTWSPDGTGLAYLAPADATGHFQLWWIPDAAAAAPAAPKQVTSNLDLDATSPPVWAQT